ncbi:MAG: BrnT family toxin [Candidatus Aureabacteria bacterium]|nr:BrnT family toxin [Candidatus Auribacterota bacterium]
MRYNFEWDPEKARANKRKHKVSFELASTVFRDPKAISVFDSEHGESEERWLTLGISATGALLVVHHTYDQLDDLMVRIRIISSRKATKRETKHYEE